MNKPRTSPPPRETEPLNPVPTPGLSPNSPLLDTASDDQPQPTDVNAVPEPKPAEPEVLNKPGSPQPQTDNNPLLRGSGACNVNLTDAFSMRLEFYKDAGLTQYLGSHPPVNQIYSYLACDYTARNTTQFRYSNGSAAQGDVTQNITYETVSNGSAYFGFNSWIGNAPVGTRYRKVVLALRGVDRHSTSSKCTPKNISIKPDSHAQLAACASVEALLPIPEGQLNSYMLNGNYYNGGNTQPAYSGVYVPDKPGYDVTVTNGSWNPNTRIATPNNPTNWAGTPVYGSDLQNATDSVTTITYIKPAASATVHWSLDTIEHTELNQTFNGRQDDPLNTTLSSRIPNGYYVGSTSPGTTCNTTTCTINTVYPAGHTDYWITCWKTVPKHESWNATLIVHYKDDQGNTLSPDQSKTITLTHDYTTRPDTGTIVVPGDWAYPGGDPTVIFRTVTGNSRNLNFAIDNPTIPHYTTNTTTALYANTGLTIGYNLVDGGNDTKEITVIYHRAVNTLPFTGGTATAATIALIGLVVAALLATIITILKRKQHHITTN